MQEELENIEKENINNSYYKNYILYERHTIVFLKGGERMSKYELYLEVDKKQRKLEKWLPLFMLKEWIKKKASKMRPLDT